MIVWSVGLDGGKVDNGWKREECLVRSFWIAGIGCVIGSGVTVGDSILI